ncbi:MAG: aspartate kinase, partial [Wenzhouxiangellaceae bacterium]
MNQADRIAPIWRVLKFGGSSVAEAQNWDRIAGEARRAMAEGRHVAIVVSALAGITDLLERCVRHPSEFSTAEVMMEVRRRHQMLAAAREVDPDAIDSWFAELESGLDALADDASPTQAAALLALGELMSSRLGVEILRGAGLDAAWLDSRELLVCDERARRGVGARMLAAQCEVAPDAEVASRIAARGRLFVLPGFVARDAAGNTVLLGRGGSDVSAALVGTLLGADRVEILSDVPGLFSADPRRIPAARLLKNISYREALELAAMGARALHPRALLPLRKHKIPLWLRQTSRPEIDGTRITPDAHEHGAQVKAIVARKNITLISLEGLDMWQQVGFLADVFGVFRDHGLSIDLVSTSESNVTLTLDPGVNPIDEATLSRLAAELGRHAQVDINTECATVSLVGLGIRTILHRLGPALEVFEQRRIFQVSQAANDLNFTVVVDEAEGRALAA